MNRRTLTLLISAVLVVVLGVVVWCVPVPYVVLSPGPTLNTLGTDDSGKDIIVLKDHQARTTSGHLNLTTVSEQSDRVTAGQALIGWIKHDEVVVPRSSIFPPGQSSQQVTQQNTEDFSESQDAATIAAACELGYPSGFGILDVDPTLGSAGKLRVGDQLVSIDGSPASSEATLTAVLKTKKVGQQVEVTVTRDSASQSYSVTLTAPSKAGDPPRLGIVVGTGCLLPFEVDLGLNNEIGGPSAGLMFALGIMDKIGPTDITKGRFIAGTGEISTDGTVSPIGGIALKMIAARKAGATIFLAPADNCGDVRGNIPSGLDVVKVSSLHDAVQSLAELAENKAVPHC